MGKNYKCWYSIYWRRNITLNNDICSFCPFQLSCISYFLSWNYFLHWPKKKTWMEELSVNKSSSKLLDTIISTPIISLTIGRTEKWFGPFLSNFSRSIQICNWILDKKNFWKSSGQLKILGWVKPSFYGPIFFKLSTVIRLV